MKDKYTSSWARYLIFQVLFMIPVLTFTIFIVNYWNDSWSGLNFFYTNIFDEKMVCGIYFYYSIKWCKHLIIKDINPIIEKFNEKRLNYMNRYPDKTKFRLLSWFVFYTFVFIILYYLIFIATYIIAVLIIRIISRGGRRLK